MTKLIGLILLITQAHAVTFEVIGPCSEKPQATIEYKVEKLDSSILDVTNKILTANNIPHVSAGNGIKSIFNSPDGLDAMEVLSDTEMRAHGWCYFVNGELFDVTADQVNLKSQNDKITWLYGYSFYDSGNWIGYCDPTWVVAPDQFCK